MMIGRNVENLDMLLRFDYSFRRILLAYNSLKRYFRDVSHIVDENIQQQIEGLLTEELFDLNDAEYKNKLIKYVNLLVRV